MNLDNRLERMESRQDAHENLDLARFGEIRETLSDIKENHLAHLQISYEEIARDTWWLRWLVMGMVAGIGAIIVFVVGHSFTV